MMERFDFLLGSWDMEYRVPKSDFSPAATGAGRGTFRRALDDKYIYFDYESQGTTGESAAHAVCVWDEKFEIYRYWWFESSGNFNEASCLFINDTTFFMNWNNGLFTQTFQKTGSDEVTLKMEHPDSEGTYEVVMEVIFTRI